MPLSRRDFHRLAAAGTLTAATTGAAVLGSPSAALAANTAYVFGYFKETPNASGDSYALHLAVSTDGLNWRPLNQNNPVATPTAGMQGLRDPFILRKQDGTFVILATDLKGRIFNLNNQYLHVWDSPDLRSFNNYRRVQMHGLATHTWAPTAFWVPSRSQYAIVYSANNGADVLMVNYTTDFRTVSANQVYYSPGHGVLDADIVLDGSTFYMYYKNLNDGLLYGARSTTGAPNSFTNYTNGLRQGNAIEAPLLIKSNSGSTWRLWGDSFSPVNNDYYAWTTSNVGANSWSVIGQRDYTPPLNAKHGSIVGITAAEYDGLVARWGLPAWVRLKSYNFPDRYVRHANNLGRIDAYPFDPHEDQLWRMVPGLASSSGVSFESVNYPGRYLRHYSYAIRLDPNDGTAAFRSDATFTQVAGLADGSWSSFRSYNFPDRYLRHSNYVLRIDPVSTATERQDATFRVS